MKNEYDEKNCDVDVMRCSLATFLGQQFLSQGQ